MFQPFSPKLRNRVVDSEILVSCDDSVANATEADVHSFGEKT